MTDLYVNPGGLCDLLGSLSSTTAHLRAVVLSRSSVGDSVADGADAMVITRMGAFVGNVSISVAHQLSAAQAAAAAYKQTEAALTSTAQSTGSTSGRG